MKIFELLEWNVSNTENRIPQIDMAYDLGKGYSAVSELMRAMILRTVEDYSSKEEFRQEALNYMYSEDEDYILSFRSICKHFGIDPDKTRYSIINAKHRISTRRRAA